MSSRCSQDEFQMQDNKDAAKFRVLVPSFSCTGLFVWKKIREVSRSYIIDVHSTRQTQPAKFTFYQDKNSK